MGKLTYQTLRENVVDVIRMKILNHELVPGNKGHVGVSGNRNRPQVLGLAELSCKED